MPPPAAQRWTDPPAPPQPASVRTKANPTYVTLLAGLLISVIGATFFIGGKVTMADRAATDVLDMRKDLKELVTLVRDLSAIVKVHQQQIEDLRKEQEGRK